MRFKSFGIPGAALIVATLGVCAAHAQSGSPVEAPSPSGPLSLQRALELTTKYQSSLRAGELRAAASQERIRDAGRWLNPEITAAAENFGGDLPSGRREGTLEVGQTFELGGERSARRATANAELLATGADAALLRLDVLARTAERFITAWALQARLVRMRDGQQLTEQAISAANERYRAGAAPVLERSRAEALALTQVAERRRAEAELGTARRELASSWGAREATFDSLATDGLPDSLFGGSHPALLRADASVSLARSRAQTARAVRVPDLTISAGLRRLEEVQGTGFVASVAVPFPLWNRGNGEVAATQKEVDAAVADRQAITLDLEVRRQNADERVLAAAAAYDTLRLRVRPARIALVGEVFGAYRAGRLGYLDLIAEQRNLLETDLALVDAEADLWRARVELELLAGAGADTGVKR